jgi:hypothetical protein
VSGVRTATGGPRRLRRGPARLLCVLALALPAALLCACGGDRAPAKAPLGSRSNPVPALPNPTKTRTPPSLDPERAQHATRRAVGRVASQHAAQRATSRRRAAARARAKRAGTASPAGQVRSGRPSDRAKRSRQRRTLPVTTPVSARRPCALVTRAQAQALIGAPILQPLQALQGPTCIYRSRSGTRFVTLAVQTADIRALRSRLRHPRRIAIASRTGYCGTLGHPMLVVGLSSGRVLGVAAPCSLAARFAARALRRLAA